MAGYGTGQIRLYEAVTGILHAEVNAHARWIYSLDIAPFSGLVSCINNYNRKNINTFFTVYCVGIYHFKWQTNNNKKGFIDFLVEDDS